jgi:hypothetical protein
MDDSNPSPRPQAPSADGGTPGRGGGERADPTRIASRRLLIAALREENGSVNTAAAFFAAAVLALAAFAVLHATGILQVPQLIFLILLVAVVFTGWDAFREWRKRKRRAEGKEGSGAGDGDAGG